MVPFLKLRNNSIPGEGNIAIPYKPPLQYLSKLFSFVR
jgi:hypothetical protein